MAREALTPHLAEHAAAWSCQQLAARYLPCVQASLAFVEGAAE